MALPIGGFMPIPLAMMIPFMATQSMVMGDAFGQAFQYGKRKISAMSNEEFNSTTMEQLASQMFQAYQNIIPDLEESIKQSRGLQSLIVTELLRLPVSIFQDVTGSSGDADSIRTSAPTGTNLPIGTQVGNKVIVGYINGVPQYSDIPSPTRTDRAGGTTAPPPQAPTGFIPAPNPPTNIPISKEQVAKDAELKLKGTIDNHTQQLKSKVRNLTQAIDANKRFSSPVSISVVKERQEIVNKAVQAISKLRIRFQETYGYWY